MEEAVTIYGLVDPRDGAVTYVGQTRLSPQRRLRAHVGGCSAERSVKARWLRELRQAGLRPGVRVLEVVPADVADDAERRHIAEQRKQGSPLANGLHDPTSAPASDVVVSVRMPQRLYDRVKQLAEADERSTAWMARRLIESALEQREPEGGRRGSGDDLRAVR